MVKKVKRKTEELKPYEHNPRRNAKAIEPVSESIKKFGLTNPIIINKDGTILAGHTRLEALKKLGIEEVECILVDGLTKDQERGFRIADNRVGELAEWDKVLLEEEIKEIGADDWEKFGFTDKALEFLKPPEQCTCPRCNKSFIKV